MGSWLSTVKSTSPSFIQAVVSVAALVLFASTLNAANKLVEFDAALTGAGVSPTSSGWTLSGQPMTNNGTFLLQDNVALAGQQFGEYRSPAMPLGTFTRGGNDYGIEFKVRPTSDVPFVGSAWPNMYLTWSDNEFNYNVHVDLFGQSATSGTGNGQIAYGRGSFSPAISNIDWSMPHDIFIGHEASQGTSNFNFYLDGIPVSTIPDSSIGRSPAGFELFRDRVGFGDGTTGSTDVSGEWHSIKVWDVNSPAQTLPPAPYTGQPRQTRNVDVFVGGFDYPNFRSPSLIKAKSGALIAFAEGRTGEEPGFYGDTDLVMKRSLDGGATWSPLNMIESPRLFGEKVSNPATVLDDSTGRVWVLYNRYEGNLGTVDSQPGTTNNTAWARYSDDHGASWSEAVDITMGVKDYDNWNVMAFGPGSGIQAQDGRLIVPGHRWQNGWSSYAVYSDDHGETWERGALTPGGNQSNENNIVELADGTLRMDARANSAPAAPRPNFLSTNGGETWGAAMNGQTVESVHAAIQRYSLQSEGDDLNRIFWTGPRGPDRNNLVVRASYDEGQSYHNERLLYDGYSGYSDQSLLPNGDMGVLFETNQARSLTFTSFNRAFVEPPSGLLAYDGFRYASASLLGNKHGGFGFNQGWAREANLTGAANGIVEASDLHYSQLPFITEGNGRIAMVSGGDRSLSRELSTTIDLDSNQTYYVSLLVRHDSDSSDVEGDSEALRVSLLSGVDSKVSFGFQGDESLYAGLNGSNVSSSSNFLTKDVSHFLVFKLVASDDSNVTNTDQVFASAFASGQTVPAAEGALNWMVASDFSLNLQDSLDRILISSGSAATWVVDELRIGTSYQAVVSNAIAILGDYNLDGRVDAADYTVWRDTLGSNLSLAADGNGNGIVDSGDFDVWKSGFGDGSGSGAGGSTSVVPEPTTAMLFLAAAVAVRIRSRKFAAGRRSILRS
jgi:sialidase-1